MHLLMRLQRLLPVTALLVATFGVGATTLGSTPSSAAPSPPQDRLVIDDLEFIGAFRLSSDTFGDSSTNYAVGTLGLNPTNRSLFIAGHAQHNAIAEFAIPAELGTEGQIEDLPVVDEPIQPFAAPLDDTPTGNPDGIDRINGLFVDDGRLLVNAERWYDAAGTARDTTLVLAADDLDGPVSGYFEMGGAVHAGGYMSPVPSGWRALLDGPVLTGWASNTSIISRHSIGPSLFTFDPADIGADAVAAPDIATRVHMNFPYAGGRWLDPDALESEPGGASDLWNVLATARYGFIVPGTASFLVVGSIGGVESGIGYKITQDDGRLCGGYCPYRHDDVSNAYWLFDVNEILAADDVHLPRPYAHGTWEVAYDDAGRHTVIGATFDPSESILYVALRNAGQVGTYDRPPLIVAYAVGEPTGGATGLFDGALATQRADRIG